MADVTSSSCEAEYRRLMLHVVRDEMSAVLYGRAVLSTVRLPSLLPQAPI